MDQATAPQSPRPRAFLRLTIVTTALTLVLVALGGAVRATGSGLACPDWPFCYGKIVPRQADIPPETGFTLFNVWLEHSHRLVASVVGVLIAVILVWALARHRRRRAVVAAAVVAAVAVNVQAALGAFVVLRKLLAELVTAHLGMAMIVVASLVVIAVAAGTGPPPRRAARDLGFARVCAAVAALAYIQILVGAHVTGVVAGLVYGRNPLLFNGSVLPTVTGAREAWHVAHRGLAYVLAAAVVYLCARAIRHRRELQGAGSWRDVHRWLVKLPMWAATLVVVQMGLGFSNLLLGTPAGIVIAHLTVASWIWTTLVVLTVLAYRFAPLRAGAPGSAAPAQADSVRV